MDFVGWYIIMLIQVELTVTSTSFGIFFSTYSYKERVFIFSSNSFKNWWNGGLYQKQVCKVTRQILVLIFTPFKWI